MATLTDDVIKQIQDLYKELGVYSQVAKKLGVSASSVKKYVILGEESKLTEISSKIKFSADIKDIKDIPEPKSLDEWRKILELTPEERIEFNRFKNEGII